MKTRKLRLGEFPRFRIVSDDGRAMGWISRVNKEEAEMAMEVIFPNGGAQLEFREEDQ